MVDARGHGLSDRIGAGGYTQELLTEDAAGVIGALGLGTPRLLGFSQGGATGVHVAAAHPHLVRSLVVAGWGDDGGNVDFTRSEGYRTWYNAYLSWLEQLKPQTHAQRMRSALSQQPPGAPLLPEKEYAAWVENCARLDLDLVRLADTLWSDLAARAAELEQALARVTCPVLIVKSSFSPQPGAPQSVREEPSGRPNVRVVRFVNAGHLVYREQFEPFVALVKDFFAGV